MVQSIPESMANEITLQPGEKIHDVLVRETGKRPVILVDGVWNRDLKLERIAERMEYGRVQYYIITVNGVKMRSPTYTLERRRNGRRIFRFGELRQSRDVLELEVTFTVTRS